MPSEQPDHAWRADMLAEVASGDPGRATDALLSLTYHDPERTWVEGVLLRAIEQPNDEQVRSLAVTCLGHVARLHRAIDQRVVVPMLQRLTADPVLRGVAQDALDDIEVFVFRGNKA